ncbi:MAG: DNA mismatch endonuclease Vsr [Sphingomonas sp.]
MSTDKLTPEARSALMAKVRSKDTAPEIRVRKAAHAMGLRFRLGRRDLPGSPDLVFPRHQLAVFVHGCFWHRHPDCRRASVPATRPDFWEVKFAKNVARDHAAETALHDQGWKTLVIWECETKDRAQIQHAIRNVIG